jgi:hypothetical protein
MADFVAKLDEEPLAAIFESRQGSSRINIAPWRSVLNQYCMPDRSKWFCNKIGPNPKCQHVRFGAALGA